MIGSIYSELWKVNWEQNEIPFLPFLHKSYGSIFIFYKNCIKLGNILLDLKVPDFGVCILPLCPCTCSYLCNT